MDITKSQRAQLLKRFAAFMHSEIAEIELRDVTWDDRFGAWKINAVDSKNQSKDLFYKIKHPKKPLEIYA